MGVRKLTASVFAASFGFYLLLAGSAAWTEDVAALGVAAAVAVFAALQHMAQDRQFALAMPIRPFLAMLGSLVTDTVRVGAVLVRPRPGEMVWQKFHPGGRSAGDTGRRALVTLLTSAAPNGFVLDIRPAASPEADHALLMHRLAPAPALSGQDWPA